MFTVNKIDPMYFNNIRTIPLLIRILHLVFVLTINKYIVFTVLKLKYKIKSCKFKMMRIFLKNGNFLVISTIVNLHVMVVVLEVLVRNNEFFYRHKSMYFVGRDCHLTGTYFSETRKLKDKVNSGRI